MSVAKDIITIKKTFYMNLNKKQGKFLNYIISQWEAEETISPETAVTLKNSFSIRKFDFKKLAKYSFWIAIFCVGNAFGAIIADDFLVNLIKKFFTSSYFVLCIIFALFAAGVYYLGLKRRKKKPNNVYSNEAIIFLGVLFTTISLLYLGAALNMGDKIASFIFLLSTLIFAVLGIYFPSRLVWLAALIALGSWFGTETGYASGWGAYYLGMNFPLRFVLFGLILTIISLFFKSNKRLSFFYKVTTKMGLLYLFIALWILSIFGNYGDWSRWYDAKQIELFHWSLLFGLVAVGAIFYGLKKDESIYRGFGITFLFINLYTRYFEYFWNSVHKAIFFLILAVSFWFIGSKAEKIWNLEFIKK